MPTATAAQVLPHVQNPNIIERWGLRRQINSEGGGDMTPLLDRQIRAMGATCTEAEVGDMMAGKFSVFQAKATVVAQGLVADEGMDAAILTPGPIMQMLIQLLQTLLPMLVSCIPVVP